MRLPVRAVLAVWILNTLWGCATYTDETHETRLLYQSENYPKALERFEALDLKDQSRNRLLYRLEKAMILDRMGRSEAARKLLIEADKIADELYTVSVSKTAASFVVNDAVTDYSGEDYEKVAIHTQLALSFIGSGDLPAARVEARKINSKLQEINSQYSDHKNRYAEDAFARYLAGLIYEARGEWDDAIIDYGKAIQLYNGSFASFAQDGVPRDLVESQARLLLRRGRQDQLEGLKKTFPQILTPSVVAKLRPADEGDSGEVVVIHERGHIAVKVAQEFVIPLGKHIVRLSFPVISRSLSRWPGETGVTDVGAGQFHSGDNVEDLDAIASFTLEDRRARLIAKSAARLIAKAQMTDKAQQEFGVLGWLAGNIYSVATETADTRGWTLLPQGYYITRLRLKAGTHTLKVTTGGRVTQIESVSVKKGQIMLLRSFG